MFHDSQDQKAHKIQWLGWPMDKKILSTCNYIKHSICSIKKCNSNQITGIFFIEVKITGS